MPLGSQPKKELTSASYFIIFSMATYQQWSQSYFPDLTPEKHETNNNWFELMLYFLKDDGELYVPILNKSFNKLGEQL